MKTESTVSNNYILELSKFLIWRDKNSHYLSPPVRIEETERDNLSYNRTDTKVVNGLSKQALQNPTNIQIVFTLRFHSPQTFPTKTN